VSVTCISQHLKVGLHCDLFIFLTVWVFSVPLFVLVPLIGQVNIVASRRTIRTIPSAYKECP
jgi:hypothetical protein